MAKLQSGTRVYGTLNVDSGVIVAGANIIPTLSGANTAVGTGANAFTSATVAGANTYLLATIAGANTAVGGGANTVGIAAFAKANIGVANVFIDTVNATRYIILANTTTGIFGRANVSNGLTFNPSSNTIILGSGGKLGIAAIPSYNLHVFGDAYITASLGVGTTPSAVTGEIRAANNVTAYYSSDRRLKENIVRINNPLEKIQQINGVNFDWTDDYLKNQGPEDGYFVRKHDVGVIAQEVKEVLPEVVGQRQDGILAVKYDRIIPLLIEAIKELKKEVEELKAR